ncbi:MAG: ribose-phosphate pyrophosphokinase [Planctomycetes bacterium]|nr:ribose-phosphate pyrophosphokinase [Planctomycetota bacterium]
MDNLKIFSGNANLELSGRIARYLDKPLGNAMVARFPDGEISVKVEEDVRGADVFIVQPTCPPVNDSFMELVILIDCMKRASAERVTAVVPYYGYARKDRKDEGRVPITAKLVANLITKAGTDRVLTMDLHAAQIQGFFDIPVDHLFASAVLGGYYRDLNLQGVVVVSPDVGSIKISRAYAKRLTAGLAVVDKRRTSPERAETGFLIGDVKDKTVIMVDDMIATGGSITSAARLVMDKGAKEVYVGATHGLFCGPAVERLSEAPIKEIAVTDSIPLRPEAAAMNTPVRVLSIASLLGEAMRRIHFNESVSSLFNHE